MNERICCCIPDQSRLDIRCEKPAAYEIWFGYNPTPDDYTDSCQEHLAGMLADDKEIRFEIFKIGSTK